MSFALGISLRWQAFMFVTALIIAFLTAFSGSLHRLREFVPAPEDFGFGTSVALVAMMIAVPWTLLGHNRGWRAGDTRKLFHLLIFTAVAILRSFAPIASVVVFGCWIAAAILYTLWRGPGFPLFESLARPGDGKRRALNVLISLIATALGGVVSHLLVGKLALVGFLVTGFGDALGEPVGIRWGKHPLPFRMSWFSGRTWEGSAAVFMASFLAATCGLTIGGESFPLSLQLAALIAPAITLVEACSPRGTDNLTIQLTTALMLLWLL